MTPGSAVRLAIDCAMGLGDKESLIWKKLTMFKLVRGTIVFIFSPYRPSMILSITLSTSVGTYLLYNLCIGPVQQNF